MTDETPRASCRIDYLKRQIDILNWVKKQRLQLDEAEQNAQKNLKDALGENEIGMIGDKPVVSWIKSWPKRFDSKRFREDHPDIWEQYKTPPKEPVRTFKLVEEQ